jgi:hypothetical protein
MSRPYEVCYPNLVPDTRRFGPADSWNDPPFRGTNVGSLMSSIDIKFFSRNECTKPAKRVSKQKRCHLEVHRQRQSSFYLKRRLRRPASSPVVRSNATDFCVRAHRMKRQHFHREELQRPQTSERAQFGKDDAPTIHTRLLSPDPLLGDSLECAKDYAMQGNKSMYSKAAMRKRHWLRRRQSIVQRMDEFWRRVCIPSGPPCDSSATSPLQRSPCCEGHINKERYGRYHSALMKALYGDPHDVDDLITEQVGATLV